MKMNVLQNFHTRFPNEDGKVQAHSQNKVVDKTWRTVCN